MAHRLEPSAAVTSFVSWSSLMKTLLSIGAVMLSLGMATPAYAISFTISDYTVTLHDTEPPDGLRVEANDVMSNGFTFALNSVGQTLTAPLFQISNPEDALNGDDLVPFPINVNFQFSAPSTFQGNAGGDTFGFFFFPLCGAFICGAVDWDNDSAANALVLPFGTTGQLALWLSNEAFSFNGGSDVVDVTFQLRALDTPAVPEPTALMLLGAGLLIGASRLRRKAKASSR